MEIWDSGLNLDFETVDSKAGDVQCVLVSLHAKSLTLKVEVPPTMRGWRVGNLSRNHDGGLG